MKVVLHGITKLFISSKGTLSLIILGISTYALFTNHLSGMYYAPIIASIGTIFCYAQHRSQQAAMQYGLMQPQAPLQPPNPTSQQAQTTITSSVGQIDISKRGT